MRVTMVKEALRRLGPKKCERALQAYDDGEQCSFDNCYLAYAYGEPGALMSAALDRADAPSLPELLGLTKAQMWAVAYAFDGPTDDRNRLLDLTCEMAMTGKVR